MVWMALQVLGIKEVVGGRQVSGRNLSGVAAPLHLAGKAAPPLLCITQHMVALHHQVFMAHPLLDQFRDHYVDLPKLREGTLQHHHNCFVRPRVKGENQRCFIVESVLGTMMMRIRLLQVAPRIRVVGVTSVEDVEFRRRGTCVHINRDLRVGLVSHSLKCVVLLYRSKWTSL